MLRSETNPWIARAIAHVVRHGSCDADEVAVSLSHILDETQDEERALYVCHLLTYLGDSAKRALPGLMWWYSQGTEELRECILSLLGSLGTGARDELQLELAFLAPDLRQRLESLWTAAEKPLDPRSAEFVQFEKFNDRKVLRMVLAVGRILRAADGPLSKPEISKHFQTQYPNGPGAVSSIDTKIRKFESEFGSIIDRRQGKPGGLHPNADRWINLVEDYLESVDDDLTDWR